MKMARLRRRIGDGDDLMGDARTGELVMPHWGPDGIVAVDLVLTQPKSMAGKVVHLWLDDRDARELLLELRERLVASRSDLSSGPGAGVG